MDRKYLLTAFGYAMLGVALGIYMAASHDHGQLVTHAHILLLGFVTSFIYAACHKLWLSGVTDKWATIQFYCHQAGTLLLTLGLFALYGNFIDESLVGPVLGIASIIAFAGVILMKVLLIRHIPKTA